jgi:hypothetical protein
VRSGNLKNKEALAQVRPQRYGGKNVRQGMETDKKLNDIAYKIYSLLRCKRNYNMAKK